MSHTRRTILIAVAGVAILAVVLAAILLGRTSSNTAQLDPTTATTAQPSSPDATTAAEATPTTDPTEQAIREFAVIWTNTDLPTREWIRALSPYVTPAFAATLDTIDRHQTADLGTDLLDYSTTHATIGTGTTPTYTLVLELPVEDTHTHEDEGTELGPVTGHDDESTEALPAVSALDYGTPPRGALPLSSTTTTELTPTITQALTVVVAQPGGLSDEGRRDLIRENFTTPTQALQIPRFGDDATSILIGNIQDLQLDANTDGRLLAYATVPYAPDGASATQTQWVTITFLLTRSTDGTWALQDAYL